jgi:hypothetical protein
MKNLHVAGPRIEFDMVSHIYSIHRPATDQRGAVDYKVTEFEVMQAIADGRHSYTRNGALELLMHDRYDVVLYPIRRREAIEHTRKLNG